MKKIFSFIVGLVAVATLQAASYTEAARITMTCEGGSESQQLDLFVDPAQASPATVVNLGSTYEVGQVNLYASYESGKFSSFKANAISNLPVVVVTNRRDASYTFTFNVPISTEGLVLTDLRSDEGVKNIPMVHNGSYTFSVEDEDGYDPDNKTNLTIADRFIINYTQYSVTLNDNFLATFSADENVIIPTGLSAYAAEYVSEEGYLNVYPISHYIPANTGVILFNEEGAKALNSQKNFSLAKYTGTDQMPTISVNDLKPASAYATNHTGHIYVLHGDKMYKYEDEASGMKPNKAFLQIDAQYPAPARIAFRFNGEQGVENVAAEGKAVKFVENGRVFIKRGEKVYNLQGQLVK